MSSRRKHRHRAWWLEKGLTGAHLGSYYLLWFQTRWSQVPTRPWRYPLYFGSREACRDLIERITNVMLRKDEQVEVTDLVPVNLATDAWTLAYPLMWKYLTQWQWDDGSPRLTASFTIFVKDFTLKMVFKEPNKGYALWATAGTIHELFEAVESMLGASPPPWRFDRKAPGDQAKRVRPSSLQKGG